jgi:diguanylate cyclase (GGDEF)-like protein
MERLLPGTPGALFELTDTTVLKEAATWGSSPHSERAFTTEDCWALRRGRIHQVSEATEPAICAHAEGAEAYVCLPLFAQGEAIGVLYLASEEPDTTFLATIARTISLSLANIRAQRALKEQSIRDPLTGLVNRRYLNEQLELEVARATRADSTIGLLILDIDHFKRFNDTWGHEAGDEVLREVGRFLAAHARQGDVVCRYGGEEFVVVLPSAPLEVVRRRAEELREGIAKLRPRLDEQSLGNITASFGAAVWPLHAETWRKTLEYADHALYGAKRAGRDRVHLADLTEEVMMPKEADF